MYIFIRMIHLCSPRSQSYNSSFQWAAFENNINSNNNKHQQQPNNCRKIMSMSENDYNTFPSPYLTATFLCWFIISQFNNCFQLISIRCRVGMPMLLPFPLPLMVLLVYAYPIYPFRKIQFENSSDDQNLNLSISLA